VKEKIFDFEAIMQLIKLSVMYDEEKREFSFNFNGKEYSIEKDFNLTLSCDDGRALSIDYSDPTDDTLDRYDYINCTYRGGHLAKEYECRSITRDINFTNPVEDIRKGFEFSVTIEGDGNWFTFTPNNENENIIDLDRSNTKKLYFVDEGIRGGDYHFSSDGKRIISYKGEIVPSKEELDNYDYDKTKEKITEALSKCVLDEYTKNAFLKSFDKGGFIRNQINILNTVYENQIPLLAGYVNAKKAAYDGRIKEDIFSKDELQFFYLMLYHSLTNIDERKKNKH